MSRTEDLSRLYVLPFLDKQYERYGEHKQMGLSRFDGYDMMSAYEEGYYQAEKDSELTWNDIALVLNVAEEFNRKNTVSISDEEYFKEVLNRFKDYKK